MVRLKPNNAVSQKQNRKCAKCHGPVEPERVKILDSSLCARCAHELEKQNGLLIQRFRLNEIRVPREEIHIPREIHVPREWEKKKKKKRRHESQQVLDAQCQCQCLINVVYDD
jgi:recombinational DNA repair protein (RecF pathway)